MSEEFNLQDLYGSAPLDAKVLVTYRYGVTHQRYGKLIKVTQRDKGNQHLGPILTYEFVNTDGSVDHVNIYFVDIMGIEYFGEPVEVSSPAPEASEDKPKPNILGIFGK